MQQCIKIVFFHIYIWSSTCFGRHTVHHQDPKTPPASSGCAYVEGCWPCSCWTLTASTNWIILWCTYPRTSTIATNCNYDWNKNIVNDACYSVCQNNLILLASWIHCLNRFFQNVIFLLLNGTRRSTVKCFIALIFLFIELRHLMYRFEDCIHIPDHCSLHQ